MQIILNIGLARTGKSNLNTRDVIAALQTNGFWPITTEVFQSDTEPTLVAAFNDSDAGLDNRIDRLASTLDQDCIATYFPDEEWGHLVGPNAAAWGEFNPEFFVMPDGTRLQP